MILPCPHTHVFAELSSQDQHHNLNYLFQGVTAVVTGNDGGGPANIPFALTQLNKEGIGTNVALFTGHGSIRRVVMGSAERHATEEELAKMETLVENAMENGALGLSSACIIFLGSLPIQKKSFDWLKLLQNMTESTIHIYVMRARLT